ncbi:MAG: lipoate--protein ligase [Bacteroidales bacterium]|nr:lipoate--protein ligase [Bacteroidales bacterium]
MFILDSPSNDPYFNIAAEEYLMKEKDGDFTFIYINDPSIIIGKHQNAYAEINLSYTRKKGIPVVRRISGGGTVWHDPGNVNFSFILNGEEGKLVNFRQYASPVLSYLQSLSVQAEFGSRNEILVNGKKISGNAEHVHRNRVLHHGTLLFSSDLEALQAALERDLGRYKDKAVQSVPSQVVNILDFLVAPVSVKEFRENLIGYLSSSFKDASRYELSGSDVASIEELVSRKYSTWKWNIGYSPKYQMTRQTEWNDKPVIIHLEVEKGKIISIRIQSDTLDRELFDQIAGILSGVDHEPGEIREIISRNFLVKPRMIDYFVEAIF